jgi:hypothetical protein
MYTITKNVIESKNYELSDMLKKLDTLWVQGSITDAEREELIALARQNAEVQQSIDILSKLEELDKRVKTLEDAQTDVPDKEPSEATYPEYEQGKWYYAGDKVTFDGNVYECIAPDGQVCTWSPSEYPAYWKQVTE